MYSSRSSIGLTLIVLASAYLAAPALAADPNLTVSRAGSGSGVVSSDVGAINCGTTCTGTFATNTVVTLTATPDSSSVFTGWLGACSGVGQCQVTMTADQSAVATFAPTARGALALDIDASTQCDALTDGLLILRYLFGLVGPSLIQAAVAPSSTRSTAAEINGYLTDVKPLLDIDGDGRADALTDGLLIIRYQFGLRGDALIGNAVSISATRATAADIEARIRTLNCAVNAPPVVSAGAGQSIALPGPHSLAGSATDDGVPAVPGMLTYAWSQDSGPTPALVANPTQPATSVSFDQPGTYVLRLTASDGALSASASTQIVVADSGPVLALLPDRTIRLGDTFRARLSASDGNLNDALTFFIDAAPSGAAFSPNPVVDWKPTAAQLGVNTFTVRVADGNGHSDSKTFKITVVAANRPPTLAAQPDQTVSAGGAFARTLSATDPDAGDTLAFALVNGPAGMSLVGNQLTWNPVALTIGDYFATVKVTDSAGAIDAARFKLTVATLSKPVARDDAYEVVLGATLTVPAAGVLANDADPEGGALTAAKLTNPGKGSVSAFNANGSFTYVAPAVLPGPVLDVKRVAEFGGGGVNYGAHPMLVADLDGDGKPELIWWDDENLYAATIATGNQLLAISGGSTLIKDGVNPLLSELGGVCQLYGRGTSVFAVGDVDDSGRPSIVMGVQCLQDDGGVYAAGGARRVLAIAYDPTPANTLHFVVKWLSPMLTTPPTRQVAVDNGYTIARLQSGETPSVLLGRTVDDNTNLTCNAIIGVSTRYCRAVWALDGATGLVRKFYTSMPADPAAVVSYSFQNGSYMAPIVADADNDGVLDILYEGTLWDVGGSIKRQFDGTLATGQASPTSALVDLDGDAQMEVVTLDARGNGGGGWLKAWKLDGTLLWALFVPRSTVVTKLSVADVDRDGKPDILFGIAHTLWTVDATGRIKWARYLGGAEDGNSFQFSTNAATFPVYDLNGDGVPDIVVQYGKETIRFLRGDTGADQTRYDYPGYPGIVPYSNPSGVMTPVIADMHGNGQASVAWYHDVNANGTTLVQVLQGNTQAWLPAPKQYNQQAYWGSNFNANGAVPTTYPRHTAVAATNIYGNQPQPAYAPGFTPIDVTTFTYAANSAVQASDPATVSIRILPVNRPPTFTSHPPRYYSTFSVDYFAHAVDPDVGDTITYGYYFNDGNNSQATVDPTTGQVHMTNLFNGDQSVIITATDNHGAVTYHVFTMHAAAGNATVPNVVGMSQSAAQSALATALLAADVTSVTNAAPAGTVLGQSPGAGTMLPQGESVYLTVSLGPAPAVVPDVVGRARTVATTVLTAAGFASTIVSALSNTIPAGTVMSQSPVAGASLVPIPANPVTLTVSAGNGLTLTLNRSATTADQTITATPAAYDANGNAVALPSLTYSIVPKRLPHLGTVPAFASSTITPAAATLGSFTITATDAANSRTASADFAVLPPRVTGVATNGESFAHMLEVLGSIGALRDPLKAARTANDVPQMKNVMGQIVTLWRTVDLDDLRISQPLVTPDQFPPTPAMMAGFGHALTPDDLVARQVLTDAIADIRAWTNALRTSGLTLAQLQAVADQFSTRAARMDGLAISSYGGIDNVSRYTALVSHEIPAFYEALSEELALISGLPPRAASFTSFKSGDGSPGLKNSLAELAVTTAAEFMIDKVMDEGSKLYKNAKKFATDVMEQAAYTAAAVAAANELKAFVLGKDIVEVVSGSSLSFREFQAAQTWIEVPADDEPTVNVVMVIGPDLITKSVQGGKDFIDALKKGYSKNLDPNSNPKRYKNLNEVKDGVSKFLDVVKQELNNVNKLIAQQAKLVFQSADTVLNGCVFTSDPECRQLFYSNGLLPVYTYAPPPGFSSLGGLPVPIVFVVYNVASGGMYFGTPAFMPCAPVGNAIQCPNNPPFTP